MPRELKNVQVTHVSFVDKAANKKKFFLTKSADTPNFETEVKPVFKADDPKQLVYGVVYEPDVEDAHKDFMTATEIEKAAHGFMENYQNIDKQHDFETEAGKVVESYIAPADIEIGETTITKGTWVLVTKATNDMWESIQKGEFTGYSLAGTAEVEELRKENTQGLLSEIKSLLKSFFITQKQESEGEEMKAEELKEVLKEAFAPINDRLTELEKATGNVEEDEKDKKKKKEDEQADSTVETMKAAVAEAMAPISVRLEKLEKSRQSNVVEQSYSTETDVKKQAAPSYLDVIYPISE